MQRSGRFCSLLTLLLCNPARAADLPTPASAELCGRCHRAIFQAWTESNHSKSMQSWLFQDALELAEADFGRAARRTCLRCHSPVGVALGDVNLDKKVSWEGVTCDYCHFLRSVSTSGANPKATVDFSLVKTGPLKDASSMAHGTEYSEVHSSSAACAPCHQYQNSIGFPLLTTFSEWKQSRHAKEGKQCQTCHMYRVAGQVVDPRVSRSSLAKINLHQMPGSHSVTQLTKAVTVQMSTTRKDNELQVVVTVTNREAGHYVPTGSPLRQLILEVHADAGAGYRFRQERLFRRVVADANGELVTRERVAFLKGAKVLSDTRLAPDEKRTETFSFPIPPGIQTQLTANLRYYYSPMERTDSPKQVNFLSLSRLVR
ncbi:MAG: hypothetical protein FJW26_17630 [Acidimicrobiia bacterium]|nr:hypothetical protein [Acidimicrobiia bacterium]